MLRTRIACVFAICAGLLLSAQSPPFPGSFPAGVFTNRAALDAAPAAGYQGPGDIVPGALGWWGLRCYSAAYSGNVADVVDGATGTTTGTRLKCASGVVSALVSASACTFVTGNACSPIATTCAILCNIITEYDQSGNSLDMLTAGGGGAPTDGPIYVPNNIGSTLPSLQCTISGGQWLKNTTGITQAQSLQISYVSNRNNNTTTLQRGVFASNGVGIYVGYGALINQAEIAAGTAVDKTATDSAFHAYQAGFNNASSNLMIDGTANTGLTTGTTGLAGTMSLCGNTFSNNYDGYIQEVGVWAGLFSGANETSMNNNQHTYWGF